MGSIGNDTVDNHWISTIFVGNTPYPYPDYSDGRPYETAVFTPAGKVIHTEFSFTEDEALITHTRLVYEMETGAFSPNGENYATIRARKEKENS